MQLGQLQPELQVEAVIGKLRQGLLRATRRKIDIRHELEKYHHERLTKSDVQQALKNMEVKLSVKEMVLLVKKLETAGGFVTIDSLLQLGHHRIPVEQQSIETPKQQDDDLLLKIEKYKKRVELLEMQAAASQAKSSKYLERARREGASFERTKLEKHFVGKIAEKLMEEYPEEEKSRESAHVAFEQILENDIVELTMQLRVRDSQLQAECRRANKEAQRAQILEDYILGKRDLFTGDFPGCTFEMTGIIRSLARMSNLGLLFCPSTDIAHIKELQGVVKITMQHMEDMEVFMRHNKWGGHFIHSSEHFLVHPFLQALAKCRAWDIQNIISNNVNPHTTAMPLELEFLVSQIKHSKDLFSSGFVDFEELNDLLGRNLLPKFNSEQSLESSLCWLDGNSIMASNMISNWKTEKLVDFGMFLGCLQHQSDEIESNFTIAEKIVDKSASTISHGATYHFDENGLATRFSRDEHSSNWAPLVNFGRKLNSHVKVAGPVAEFITSSSRPVLVYVEGILSTTLTSVKFLNERPVEGNGSVWGLCVTSSPPANRPVKGSVIYEHTGRVQVLEDYFSYTEELAYEIIQKWAIVPETMLRSRRRAGKQLSDEHLLLQVYSPIFPKNALQNAISSVKAMMITSHSKEAKVNTEEEIFIQKGRELECIVRMEVNLKSLLKYLKNSVSEDSIQEEYRKLGRKTAKGADNEMIKNTFAAIFNLYLSVLDEKVLLKLCDSGLIEPTNEHDFKKEVAQVHQRILDYMKLNETLLNDFKVVVGENSGNSKVRFGERIGYGEILGASFDAETNMVKFYANGKFQAQLRPSCPKPWRFAFFCNSSSSCRIIF